MSDRSSDLFDSPHPPPPISPPPPNPSSASSTTQAHPPPPSLTQTPPSTSSVSPASSSFPPPLEVAKTGDKDSATRSPGSDESIQNEKGESPHQLSLNRNLIAASTAGEVESVNSLMQQGASVHSKDGVGNTGLHESAKHGHDDIVKIFLSKGVEVNIRGNGQRTPLMWAASELLSRGARVDATNNEGDTAIKTAEQFGHFDVISMFAAWHNSESRAENLFQGADEGKTRLARGLLIAGADYNYKVSSGEHATWKRALLTHIKSTHEGVKYPCEQCDYKATQKSHLLTHIKSIHEGVKFPCKQCDYKATEKGNLLRHIKSTHEGIKYPCEQCDYKATQKNHLLKHIKSIH